MGAEKASSSPRSTAAAAPKKPVPLKTKVLRPSPALKVDLPKDSKYGLPYGWRVCNDIKHGETYYYNDLTGKRQWKAPSFAEADRRRRLIERMVAESLRA